MDGVSIPARCDFLAAKFVRKKGLVSRINLHSTFSLSGRFLNVPIRRTSGRYVVWDDGTGGIGFFMLCVFSQPGGTIHSTSLTRKATRASGMESTLVFIIIIWKHALSVLLGLRSNTGILMICYRHLQRVTATTMISKKECHLQVVDQSQRAR